MKEHPSIRAVLRDPNKMQDESQNVLARLLRQIAYELAIGEKTFSVLINRYLNDPFSGIITSDNPHARINHRGNMIKEFGAPKITWAVFEKWLKVIGANRYQVVINIERNNVVTQHAITIQNQITEEKGEDLSRATVLDRFPDSTVSDVPKIVTGKFPPKGNISQAGIKVATKPVNNKKKKS